MHKDPHVVVKKPPLSTTSDPCHKRTFNMRIRRVNEVDVELFPRPVRSIHIHRTHS